MFTKIRAAITESISLHHGFVCTQLIATPQPQKFKLSIHLS